MLTARIEGEYLFESERPRKREFSAHRVVIVEEDEPCSVFAAVGEIFRIQGIGEKDRRGISPPQRAERLLRQRDSDPARAGEREVHCRALDAEREPLRPVLFDSFAQKLRQGAARECRTDQNARFHAAVPLAPRAAAW